MSEQVFFSRLQAELDRRVTSFEGVAGITVIDLKTGTTLGCNQDLVLATASSIKVPLLACLFLQDAAGRIDVRSPFTVDERHMVGGSGVLQHLDHPATLALEDVASLMINVSDNVATNILIDLVGMDFVNTTMESLGFHQTRLRRKMIDNVAAARGDENVSTPREAAELMRRLYAGEIGSREISDRVLKILKKPKRTSPVARLLPQTIVIANKPGGLEGVSCEFAIIYLERRPYVFSCMTNWAVVPEPADFVAELSLEVFRYFDVLNRSTGFGRRLGLRDFADVR
jgi:beta-lactamase class A